MTNVISRFCWKSPTNQRLRILNSLLNAESSGLANAIIFCSNKKCEKQTPTSISSYYVGIDGNESVNGLIECIKTTVEPNSSASDTTNSSNENANDHNNNTNENTSENANANTNENRRKRENSEVEKCVLKSSFTSQGYYFNSGYNKAINQTIMCDSSDGCQTIKVDLGYYVNAGNSDKPIIKCEKEGNECNEIVSPECPSKDIVNGNYCYDNGQLKFYPNSTSTGIVASKSDDVYSFASISSQGFPDIKSEISTFFKISRYYINRFYQSGIVMLNKNGKLVDNLSSDQSEVTLYDCNDSTKMCSERPGCTSNTYMFDSENKKAVFCNNGKLEYADFTGYVVDGSRTSGNNKHPYIIHCESNGEKCSRIKPKISTYYENNGYNSSSNSLIQCSNNNCMTVVAEVGYYVGRGDDGNSGIIKCASSTSCTYSQVKSKVKNVNAGSDKMAYAIIECTKTNGCSVAKARTGYYLTYT
eukprot:jgi/Orpsp1_1/1184114/evm.model.c7180000088062.2